MLKDSLNFNTPEEGRAKIRELRKLQSRMVGTLYPEVLEDEIAQIEHKINEMLYGQPSDNTNEVKDYPPYLDLPKGSYDKFDNDSKSIDWEQRRYEIAKDSMIGIMANSELYKQILCEEAEVGCNVIPNALAKASIIFADSLIRELKS